MTYPSTPEDFEEFAESQRTRKSYEDRGRKQYQLHQQDERNPARQPRAGKIGASFVQAAVAFVIAFVIGQCLDPEWHIMGWAFISYFIGMMWWCVAMTIFTFSDPNSSKDARAFWIVFWSIFAIGLLLGGNKKQN